MSILVKLGDKELIPPLIPPNLTASPISEKLLLNILSLLFIPTK